mgnify:CR=1 FL=1
MVFSSKRPIDDSRREEVINDVDDDFRGTDSVTVLELSKETLEKIKENAPSRPPKREDFPIDDEPDGDIEPEDEGDKLWEHQSRAIDQWFGNNGRGIIAHATGTGKTFTSIKLIEKINKFAPIKYILKNNSEDDQKIIELLEDISRDLMNYDLEFRIQELESKFSVDMSESTFNELKELKKKQNLN